MTNNSAKLRKQIQREKEKEAGLKRLSLTISSKACEALQELAKRDHVTQSAIIELLLLGREHVTDDKTIIDTEKLKREVKACKTLEDVTAILKKDRQGYIPSASIHKKGTPLYEPWQRLYNNAVKRFATKQGGQQ